MNQTQSKWMTGAALCAVILASTAGAHAQEGRQLIRIGMTELKSGGRYDHAEAAKMLNAAAKKAGTPWRDYWRTSVFGEMGTVFTVAPVSSLAMFDGESSLSKMTGEERARYTTLVSNSVGRSRYRLAEIVPELSIRSGRTTAPKLARATIARVTPGKQAEFEEALKTILLPAFKKAGIKDYWVSRTLLGSNVGEYMTVLLFEKWADADVLISLEKMLGPEAFKQYQARVAGAVSEGENLVLQFDESLSYRQ